MAPRNMLPQLFAFFFFAFIFLAPSAWGGHLSFQDFLHSEESAGRLDRETVLLYQVYALQDPDRLPESYRAVLASSPALENGTLIFREVQSRWWEWSPKFREKVSPFFLIAPPAPPPTQGSSLRKSLLFGHRMANWAQTNNFNFEWGATLNGDTTDPCGVAFTDSSAGPDPCPPIPYVVKQWAEYFERSWTAILGRSAILGQLGYRAPDFTATSLVDVFFANTGCNGESWCTIPQLNISAYTKTYCGYLTVEGLNCGGTNGEQNIAYILIKPTAPDSTAAHEFFHVVQFSTDPATDPEDFWWDLDLWWLEATSSWVEDQVFDDANGYIASIKAWLMAPQISLRSVENTHEYGSSLFAFYLSEKFGKDIIRDIWEDDPLNGIYGIKTIDEILKERGTDLSAVFKDFTVHNALMDYEEGDLYGTAAIEDQYSTYPVSSSVILSSKTSSGPYYGAQYILFHPPDGAEHTLTLTFDGRDDATWGAEILAVKRGGGYDTKEISLGSLGQSGCLSFSGFGSIYEKVYLIPSLLISSGGDALYDYGGTLDEACPTSNEVVPSSTQSNGNKRCFIAAAADGSFEGPYLQILRKFRDRYLTPYPLGEWLVETYYRVSPPLADFVAAHPLAAFLTRIALLPLLVLAVFMV